MSAAADSLSTRVDPEEIEQTTSEKALAFVLAAFIFIGGVWGYVKLAEVDRPERGFGAVVTDLAPEQRNALQEEDAAQRELREARNEVDQATRELTLSREAYRTALEAGEPAEELRRGYVAAQRRLDAAEASADQAAARIAEVRPEAQEARAALAEAHRAEAAEARESEESHDRTVLLLRLALILGMSTGAIVLLGVLRSRRSRYLPLAIAWLGAFALLGIGLAADYAWGDITELSDLGPLFLAIAGTAITLAGFVALQRYLSRRLPIRRVRNRECPFCGFRGEGEHCEGCGRRLLGECAECHAPRRVGTPHCATCGKA
jgi:hypothetical protein